MSSKAAFAASALMAMMFCSCGDIDAGGPFAPDQQAGAEYFPFAEGNSWRYVRTGSGMSDSLEYTVTGMSSVSVGRMTMHAGGFELAVVYTAGSDTLHFKTGDEPQIPYFSTEYVHVSDSIVEAFADTVSTTPLWTIPLPLSDGDTWLFRRRPTDIFATVLTVDGTCQTQFQEYTDILEIEASWEPDSASTRTMIWFDAPGTGTVALIDSVSSEQEGGDWCALRDELRSFSQGSGL